jgi:hypothetical protein
MRISSQCWTSCLNTGSPARSPNKTDGLDSEEHPLSEQNEVRYSQIWTSKDGSGKRLWVRAVRGDDVEVVSWEAGLSGERQGIVGLGDLLVTHRLLQDAPGGKV